MDISWFLKYFIAKKMFILLLVEGLASMLMAAERTGRWLLKARVAVATYKTALMFAIVIDSSFHKEFSVPYYAV